MKVIIIDPWPELYVNGLSDGLSRYVDVHLYTNFYFEKNNKSQTRMYKVFFKYSDRMPNSILRLILRGLEYTYAYYKLVRLLKKGNFDVVHFQWLLMYTIDVYFLRIIKKYTKKLVFTAHNVTPHDLINLSRHIDKMGKVYSIVDEILVHGEFCYQEFCKHFSSFHSKLKIQYHGTYLNQKKSYNVDKIDGYVSLSKKILNKKRIYIYFGNMFYNKGVDRIIKIWLSQFSQKRDCLLIVAGKKNNNYKELNILEIDIMNCQNILYVDHYVADDQLNYFISNANLILLPYREASMSGVVFTASEFCKPVLTTGVGSIPEYLENNRDSYIVENSANAFKQKLIHIDENVSNEELLKMGRQLNDNINSKFCWGKIAQKLISQCYKTSISLHESK